jgi:pyruvate formate lyase activating enzyme
LVTGLIFDIKRFAVHDGPGIRTTVFFKGCPLHCSWCHNPESQSPTPEMMVRANRCVRCGACFDVCEQGAVYRQELSYATDSARCTLCGACEEVCYAGAREIVGREMTQAQVMAEIERDIPFYDESGGGVTFSGGEPLMQPDFLSALLQACRCASIHTALDTCGFAPWQTLDLVREHIDLFLYDLKLMDAARHRQHTGVSNRSILHNLEALSRAGHAIELRVPLLPGLNDDEENLSAIARFAATLPRLAGITLLPYHAAATEKYERLGRQYRLHGLRPPSDTSLTETTDVLQKLGVQVRIGG